MTTPAAPPTNGHAGPDLELEDADVPRHGLNQPFVPRQRFSFVFKNIQKVIIGTFIVLLLASFGVVRGCATHDEQLARTPLPEPSAASTGPAVIGANVTAHSDRSNAPTSSATPPLMTPTLAPGQGSSSSETSTSPVLQNTLTDNASGLRPDGTTAQSYTLPPQHQQNVPAIQTTAQTAAAQTVPNPQNVAQPASADQIVVSGGVQARSPVAVNDPDAPQQQTQPSVASGGTNVPNAVRATTPGAITASQQQAFAQNGSAPYLASVETQAISQTEVFAGTPIRAILDTDINTTICGNVFAHVTDSVSASLKPYPVVIPPFSKLVGRYNCDVQPGQNRLQISWDYIKMPNGTTFPLGGVSGSENDGSVGLNAKVDDHKSSIYTTTFLASLIDGVQQRLSAAAAAEHRNKSRTRRSGQHRRRRESATRPTTDLAAPCPECLARQDLHHSARVHGDSRSVRSDGEVVGCSLALQR